MGKRRSLLSVDKELSIKVNLERLNKRNAAKNIP